MQREDKINFKNNQYIGHLLKENKGTQSKWDKQKIVYLNSNISVVILHVSILNTINNTKICHTINRKIKINQRHIMGQVLNIKIEI